MNRHYCVSGHGLFDFSTMSLVQGENTVKDFYSKLEECNKSFGHREEFLKCTLLKGLSNENRIKVLLDGLEILALDEIVERLSPDSDLPARPIYFFD